MFRLLARFFVLAMISASLLPVSLHATTAPSIWAIVRPQDPVEDVRELLRHEVVGGVVYYATLRILTPREGEYDWTGIDAIMDLCVEAKKPLKLALLGGRWVPDWLYEKGARKFTWTHDTSYVEAGRGTASACVPWDTIYLDALQAALRDCARRYGDNPWLREVQVTGPALANGLEMNLSITSEQAASIGYSRRLLADAWKRMTDFCAEAFPCQTISLALHNDLLGERTAALAAEVRDHALAEHPGRVSLLVCYATHEPWFQRGNSAVDMWAKSLGGALLEAQLIDLFSAKRAPVAHVGSAIRRAAELGAARIEIFFADLHASPYREGVEAALRELGATP